MKSWDNWRILITITNGRCTLKMGRFGVPLVGQSTNDVLWGCWETRWSAIQCGSHGGALSAADRKLRWNAVSSHHLLVLSNPRARRTSPPRDAKLPPLSDGYVQPFRNGRLRPEIHPRKQYAGTCSVGWQRVPAAITRSDASSAAS